MGSMLDIGISSLMASKAALTVTNQNVANANNPAYSRRQINFVELSFSEFGNGVGIGEVNRIAEQFANDALISTNSHFAKADSLYQSAFSLESYLDSDSVSLTKAFNSALTDLNSLNGDPASIPGRNLYLSQLNTTAGRFNAANSEMNRIEEHTKFTMQADIVAVNNTLDAIDEINQKLKTVNSGAQSEAYALFDERDKQLNTLSEHLNMDYQLDEKGVVSIQVGSGTPLLTSLNVNYLVAGPSNDGTYTEIYVNFGTTQVPITDSLTGGDLAGMSEFQQQILHDAKNQIGRLALVFADNLNQQNQLGMDLNGDLGGRILNDINAASLAGSRVIPNSLNPAGAVDLDVSITDTNALTTSDYELSFTSATDYALVRKSDQQSQSGTTTIPGTIVSADGFTINVNAGTFSANHKYTISPTFNAASTLTMEMTDSRKLALASPVAVGQAVGNTGDGKIEVVGITDVSTADFATPKQLSPPLRIEFTSDTTYSIVNATTSAVIEAGLTYDPAVTNAVFPTAAAYDPGYRVSLQGSVKSGDVYTVDYNVSGTSDNRNGLLLAEKFNQRNSENSTLTFGESYLHTMNNVSSKTYIAKLNVDTQQILKEQTEARRDQISGVSLEEEMMNITKFEQSYMASAQILDVAKDVFDTVLSILRR